MPLRKRRPSSIAIFISIYNMFGLLGSLFYIYLFTELTIKLHMHKLYVYENVVYKIKRSRSVTTVTWRALICESHCSGSAIRQYKLSRRQLASVRGCHRTARRGTPAAQPAARDRWASA